MTLEDIIKTVYIGSDGYRPERSPYYSNLSQNKGIFFATLKLFLVSRCLGERSALGILSLTQVVCTIVILTNIVFIL